ncbi:hypothetical protein DV735_g2547, partial [Chaetothyriales sp. CBS 134920]
MGNSKGRSHQSEDRISNKMRRRFLTQASKSWRAQLAASVQASGQDGLRCPRCLSSSALRPATTLPATGTGPPPAPPKPDVRSYGARVDEKRRKMELLKQGKEIRAGQPDRSSSPLKRRFWKEVHVQETADGYRVLLDKRPVRLPSKAAVVVPLSKPHLAHAIAIEWDMLASAQDATKNHHIPLTSIVSRAQDIADADAANDSSIREAIVSTMVRYLDTDTLLCWAPESDQDRLENGHGQPAAGDKTRPSSLRQLQIDTAKPVIAHLTTRLWPGVDIKPALESNSIMPTPQSELTRSVVSGWVSSLPPYELAALERAVLASKSFLVGARLLIEWSEEFRHLQQDKNQRARFGIEEAAQAASVEVNWQTAMWGEVEDTHDVEHEDIRRQLGSAVLLVSGTK